MKERLILYVDESARHLDFQKAFASDYLIRCVPTAKEALDVLARKPVMALVTAHNLRDLSGIELCERAQTLSPGLIRILLTTPGGKGHALDAMNTGTLRRFLVEPWDPEELRQVVRDQLRRIRLEQRVRRLKAKTSSQLRGEDPAVTRACLLNDLAKISRTVTNCCTHFELLLQSINGVVDDDVFTELGSEFDKLQAATSYLSELHAKTDMRFRQRAQSDEVYRLADLFEATVALIKLDTVVGPRLQVSCPRDILVSVDRTDLSRIVMNLMLNSLQAFEGAGFDRGQISIRGIVEGEHVVISVEDNGPGIPDELTSQVFEPFYTTKADSFHTGLGLTLVRELVAAHNGSVELFNSAAEPGTKVVVHIPAALPLRSI